MVATVGEWGGAARSAAMSVVVMRGLLGASAAFSVFSWALIFRRLPADAFKYFSHDLRVRRSHPLARYPSGRLDKGTSFHSLPSRSLCSHP